MEIWSENFEFKYIFFKRNKSLKKKASIFENQNKELLNKMETAADKIKSFNDMKKELKAFFSVAGYSMILNTKRFHKEIVITRLPGK